MPNTGPIKKYYSSRMGGGLVSSQLPITFLQPTSTNPPNYTFLYKIYTTGIGFYDLPNCK